MKRICLAFRLLFVLLFVSCNKDGGGSESDYSELIVGSWDTKVEMETKDGPYSEEGTIIFTKDGKINGTFVSYQYYCVSQDMIDGFIFGSDYFVSGNQLIVRKNTYKIRKLTETELEFESEIRPSRYSSWSIQEKYFCTRK